MTEKSKEELDEESQRIMRKLSMSESEYDLYEFYDEIIKELIQQEDDLTKDYLKKDKE